MKTQLLLAVIVAVTVSCRKSDYHNPQNKTMLLSLDASTDPRIGRVIKWKCTGGDTLFNDTLKMKLEYITMSLKQKKEYLHHSLTPNIWTISEYVGTEQDLQQLTQLAFTSPDCKTVYFTRLP
jgi:hypothetical protein